jgi:hypothetical protein
MFHLTTPCQFRAVILRPLTGTLRETSMAFHSMGKDRKPNGANAFIPTNKGAAYSGMMRF